MLFPFMLSCLTTTLLRLFGGRRSIFGCIFKKKKIIIIFYVWCGHDDDFDREREEKYVFLYVYKKIINWKILISCKMKKMCFGWKIHLVYDVCVFDRSFSLFRWRKKRK